MIEAAIDAVVLTRVNIGWVFNMVSVMLVLILLWYSK
jgi:hypothetical protein